MRVQCQQFFVLLKYLYGLEKVKSMAWLLQWQVRVVQRCWFCPARIFMWLGKGVKHRLRKCCFSEWLGKGHRLVSPLSLGSPWVKPDGMERGRRRQKSGNVLLSIHVDKLMWHHTCDIIQVGYQLNYCWNGRTRLAWASVWPRCVAYKCAHTCVWHLAPVRAQFTPRMPPVY